ncbi:MAG: TetR/AcrR family transcriptional regulator [Alphaproteobacteria bacterium]|nr:TetR/AcrR family transcriptional regulator [Alphaproteobacteria bacterium]MBV9554376.1 TetR/AcrR family transcriptional regulator [Alphaproteobacteria bacterium]
MTGPTVEHGRPETRGRGGRPSRQQSAQLAERILDVAESLFLGHGFGATSIEAVAKRAGISKRTFYHRFPGKEQLFEAVVRRLMQRWLPPFDAALLSPPDLGDALQAAAEYMLRIALTPEALALHRLVIHEAQRFPGLARILHELGAASGIERIASHLAPRIASGELRGDLEPRFAAEQFILSIVTAPQRRALGLGVPLSAGEIAHHARAAVTLFLDGARARSESA